MAQHASIVLFPQSLEDKLRKLEARLETVERFDERLARVERNVEMLVAALPKAEEEVNVETSSERVTRERNWADIEESAGGDDVPSEKPRVQIVSCGYVNHSYLPISAKQDHWIFNHFDHNPHAVITDERFLASLWANFPSLVQQSSGEPYAKSDILILDCRDLGENPADGTLQQHLGLHPELQQKQLAVRETMNFWKQSAQAITRCVAASSAEKLILTCCKSGNHSGPMVGDWTQHCLRRRGYRVELKHLTEEGEGWNAKWTGRE